MRLLLAAAMVSVSLAQPLEDCEERLVGVANRYANDYNSYMHQYHVLTVSAKPHEKEQSNRRKRLKEEFEAVTRCECW